MGTNAGGDRSSDSPGSRAEDIALVTADLQDGDDVAQITDDVERFLEEYISGAEAAGNRETLSLHGFLDSGDGAEDRERDAHSRHGGRSSPAADNVSSSSEDEIHVESEPQLAMEADSERPSSSQEPEDVEVERTASLLQRFEDALVEDQEDEDEEDFHGESEAESDGDMEESVKEGALVNSWLEQPIVYPVQRYSGLMNVEVCKYSHTWRHFS